MPTADLPTPCTRKHDGRGVLSAFSDGFVTVVVVVVVVAVVAGVAGLLCDGCTTVHRVAFNPL